MRSFYCITLAALSFLTVAHFIDSLAPFAINDLVGDKLSYFSEHKDTFDLLVFGSSRTLAGVIPQHLDTEIATRGSSLHSFNFAINAMHPHETDALIRRVLKMEPARLRWVLIELGHWTGAIHRGKEFRLRTYFWHDLRTTVAATRSTALYYKQKAKKPRLLLQHLLHLGGHLAAFGRGPEIVKSLWRDEREQPRLHRSLRDDNRGYAEPEWHTPEESFAGPCGAPAGVDQLHFYKKRLGRVHQRNQDEANLDRYDIQALKNQIETLRRAGVEPIFMIPPRLRPTPDLFLLEPQGIIEHLWAFNQPKGYPVLFELDQRWDCDHLNRQGAEIFSTLIAERLAGLVENS